MIGGVSAGPSGSWSSAPPWQRAGGAVFSRAARLAAAQPGVRWAQLAIRGDLLGEDLPRSRAAVPVAERVARGGLAPNERASLELLRKPRPLPSRAARRGVRVRVRGAPGILAYALRIEGRVAGLLHFACAGDGATLEGTARRIELLLEADLSRRRLAAAEAHYRTILESAGDAILIVESRTGRVIEANRRAAALSRYRPADLVGRVLWTLLSDETVPRGAPPAAISGRDRGRPVLALLRRRGEPLPVAVTFARVPGPTPLLHLILTDVSAEERARRELTQAKETLAAIAMAAVRLQTPSDRHAVFEVIGRELAGLGYFTAVLLPQQDDGRSEEGAAARPWEVAHLAGPPERAAPPERLLGSVFPPGRVRPLVRALRSGRAAFSDRPADVLRALAPPLAADAARFVEALDVRGLLVAPFGREGAAAGAIVVAGARLGPADGEAVDAFARQAGLALERARLYAELRRRSAGLEAEVERRTRELTLAVRALREIDRRKDNFMANVSHELRTPLVTILGYTQLLLSGRMGTLAPEQERCLGTVHRNGQRLRDFIEELVDFSRHELTRETLRPEPFDIRQAVDQATAALYPRVLERGLRVTSRVASGTPPAFGERNRIVQVLSNLLFNAERHCEPGGRLRVAVSGGGGRIRVSVSDDGVGIAPEHRDRIFERLYQVGDRTAAREKGAGLGLGLAIAKSIVEAHGGRIWVDGRPRRGSRFRFELPSADILAARAPA